MAKNPIPNYSDRTYSMINQLPTESSETSDYIEEEILEQNIEENQQQHPQLLPHIIEYKSISEMNDSSNQLNQINQVNQMNELNEIKPKLPTDHLTKTTSKSTY